MAGRPLRRAVVAAQKTDVDQYRARLAEIEGEEHTIGEAEYLRREALLELGGSLGKTEKRVKRDAKRRRQEGL